MQSRFDDNGEISVGCDSHIASNINKLFQFGGHEMEPVVGGASEWWWGMEILQVVKGLRILAEDS